jgi:hypothetical protein
MAWKLENPIILEELTKALFNMANGKSFGPSNIVTKFFKCLWLVIGDDYLLMVHKVIASNLFPTFVIERLITLLHKGSERTT